MSARFKAKSHLPATVDEHPGAAARVLSEIIERGARVQGPAVHAYVERLRDGNADATPAEIVTKLEKQYLAAVMASGAAVGSAAAIPGVGNRLMGKRIIENARMAFGPPPPRWPSKLHVLPSPRE